MPGDTVIIMWTSVAREDRWRQGQWLTPGNIYSQHDYPESWVKDFADDRWYLMRDLATVAAARDLLEHWGCRWIFTSMMPLGLISENDDHVVNDDQDVLDLYKDALDVIRPSVFETIFNNDWASRPLSQSNQNQARSRLKQLYQTLQSPSWPSWDDFISGTDPQDSNIWQEMKSLRIFQGRRRLVRGDGHPTPAEHLEYVHKILPEFQLDISTVEWIRDMDQLVLDNKSCKWSQHRPTRFG